MWTSGLHLQIFLSLVIGLHCTNVNIANEDVDHIDGASGGPFWRTPEVNFEQMGRNEILLYAEKFRNSPSKLMELDPYLVGFYVYTKKHPMDPVRVYANQPEVLKASRYNPEYKTKIIVHGFMNMLTSETIQTIKNNLLLNTTENMNVVAVDWSQYAVVYYNVYMRTYGVGSLLAEFIEFLVSEGTSLEDIHCIGHSLGAHVCGYAGSQVQSGKIARITGLDPARPGFTIYDESSGLSKDDAKFVDCIHTCAGGLGSAGPFCSADYYANLGFHQPGCTMWDLLQLGACSHGRSHDYFAESIFSNHLFPAVSCPFFNFTRRTFEDCIDDGALMGYPANEKQTGIFYAPTEASSPYAPKILKTDSTAQLPLST